MTQPVQAQYPTLDTVRNAVSRWVNSYRERTNQFARFGQCSPDDVDAIAKDLALSTADLRALSRKSPDSAANLQRMLAALHVDPAALAQHNPLVLRDLQRLCVMCADKQRCEHEFDTGTAAEHFHEYCPNAYTLDALVQQDAKSESASEPGSESTPATGAKAQW